MRRLFVLALFALGLVLGMSGPASATDANGNHATYTWLIGVDPPFADTAIAPDGSTITMGGTGTLKAGPDKSATGGGTFSLSSGGSGTWTATAVQGFVSYGEAIPQGLPGLFGGEAKLKITLSNGDSGVLTIICLLGSPPAGKMEGITVILGKGGQFTKQDGGDNVFIGS
jgi:hypothetical protein